MLPHDKDKQYFGWNLVITGLLVDTQVMTISLNFIRKAELIAAICSLVDISDPNRGHGRKLRDWLHLSVWMRWALNVSPLLQPALSCACLKVVGKNVSNAPLSLNAEVKRDFSWLLTPLSPSTGFTFFGRHLGDHARQTFSSSVMLASMGLALVAQYSSRVHSPPSLL